MAKLAVLRSHSSPSGKESITKVSDGMNSYVEKGEFKEHSLSPYDKSFVPQMLTKQKELGKNYCKTAAQLKEKMVPQFTHPEPLSFKDYVPYNMCFMVMLEKIRGQSGSS